jgi:HEAT repeat protein
LDQDTRRQITWIAFIALVIAVVVLVAHGQTEVDNLLHTISTRTPDARVRAVTTLIEEQRLAEALEDQPRWTQDRAVEAASALGTERALEQLVAIKPIVDAPVAARIDSFMTSLGARAVGPLVITLQDKDAAVRSAASGPLKTIGEPAVVSLMPLIDVYDDAVRGLVSTTLGGIGEPAVEPLLTVMKQDQPGPDQGPAAFRRSKTAAVAAFNAMGETALEPVIGELLEHDDPSVRLAATGILGTVAAGLDDDIAAEAVPPLLGRLTTDDAWAVRRRAASALAGLDEVAVNNDAVTPLIATLDDPRAEVRASAAQALGTLEAEAAAGPLVNLLTTNRIGATAEIAGALERIGRPAIQPLRGALDHPELDVRLTATETIATIGTDEAVVPLGVALRDDAVKVRTAAANALRNLADQRVLPELANALGDTESSVYYGARDAMVRIGRPAVPGLLDRLGEDDTRIAYTAQQALSRIGEEAVQPLIEMMRTTGDTETVRWAAVALGEIGSEAVEPASDLLGDTGASTNARRGAARALGIAGSFAATDPLTEAVEDAPPPVQEAAVRALGEIGDDRATEALVAALGAEGRDVRETAMKVLIDWRLGDVDEKLANLVEIADEDAARRAAVVLAQHTPAASGELIRAIGATEVAVPGEEASVRQRLEQTVEDARTGEELRRMAITALRWVGTEASLDALAPLVKVGSGYAEVAATTIGHIGQRLARLEEDQLEEGEEVEPSQATNLLLDVYRTAETEQLRLTAAEGLAVMGGQPVGPLIDMLRQADNNEERAWLIAVLASVGKPAVDPLLDARGRTDDAELRNWLAASLVLIGDARAIDLIDQLPEQEQPEEAKLEAGREVLTRIQQNL